MKNKPYAILKQVNRNIGHKTIPGKKHNQYSYFRKEV